MASVPKKYVLITGCTPGGIGHYLSLEFAEKGFNVLSTVRDPSNLTPPHPSIQYVPLELTNPASITALYEQVCQITNGKLDILYNNAGRNYTVPSLDMDFDEVQLTFEVNTFAVMRICQIFAPLMIQSKGTIVQTGSLAGVMPYVLGGPYNASKAALHSYSNTLRVELAPLGVKVITVITGGVKSNIARTNRQLPPDSYFIPIMSEYQHRLTYSQHVSIPTEKYARSVVKQILRGDGWFSKLRWIWEGKRSFVVWFAQRFLFAGVFDYYFTHVFKLWKLKGAAEGKKRV
ncbi:NAD(P)-binding protein [Zopfia rhizophila CBS 207.26]|uniref:NAD(P)-binding protein n=1 Tax=Zopfia rhizophila CBS 207.26 TaxID=1314779 RepID=A0A6A6DZT2_9PEZI|nr:NAD(P)-binding protein [Zopfia rhizophila CBS 207.26]